MFARSSLSLALLLLAGTAFGQDKKDTKPGDAMIEKYLAAETDKLSRKFLDGAKTLEEWKQNRPRLHREYLDMLGLWPLPDKTPLKAAVTGQLEAHGVVVEKLHFQSKPGLYVTANFYRPKEVKGKLPTILYVCGHSNRGRDGSKAAYQDHGFWFANNGYACLILDTLQLGEIPGVHHGTYGRPWNHLNAYENGKDRPRPDDHVRWWWHSAGYTPAGVECWNGVRAIDYLLTRPEVDPDRIGVTGISGGGAATFWIAAADDRVKVAVPVSGMSDLPSYVKNKIVNGHCDCMFLYNTHQWDWTTIAALIAPRPLLFANSDNDPIFPMDANRRIIAKLRQLYQMYGQPGLVDEYVSVGGHAYRPDLRVAIFKFLNKHLKGDTTTPVKDADFADVPGKDLRVFPTDADIPKDAINAKIDETFVPRAKVALPEEGKFAEWKKEKIQQLLAQPLQSLAGKINPARRGSAVFPHGGTWIAEGEIEFGRIEYTGKGDVDIPTVVVLDEQDKKNETAFEETIRPLGGFGIMIFPRGVSNPWSKKSPPNYVERSHALLGRTVDEGRLLDILATFKAESTSGREPKVRIIGLGQAGILAAYAALFEPSIKEVVVIDPPTTHKDGPHFLGVLRVLDVPEALGLLAPTPLTIVGGRDPAFDRTEEIYRRAGAADKLKRK